MRPLLAGIAVLLAAACASPGFQEVADSPAGAFEASLATFDDGMVVAWYDGRDGRAAIYYRAIDGRGRPVGLERRIAFGPHDAYEADVAPMRSGFAVGWYEKSADGHLTPKLGAWTRDGTEQWVKTLAPAGRNTVVRAGGGAVFAAWIVDEDDERAGVWGAWWREDGTELFAPRRLADAGRTTWNLNAAIDPFSTPGHLRAWVVFDAKAGTRSEELFVVEAAEAPAAPVRLTPDDGVPSKYPDVAFSGERVALTWFDERDGNEEVYLYVGDALDPAEGGLPARRVTDTPGESVGAYLAWNGERLGLAWCDDTEGQQEIYFQSFDAAGAPLGEVVRVTHTPAASSIPAIRPWQSGFALAWSEHDAPAAEGHGAAGRAQIALAVMP